MFTKKLNKVYFLLLVLASLPFASARTTLGVVINPLRPIDINFTQDNVHVSTTTDSTERTLKIDVPSPTVIGNQLNFEVGLGSGHIDFILSGPEGLIQWSETTIAGDPNYSLKVFETLEKLITNIINDSTENEHLHGILNDIIAQLDQLEDRAKNVINRKFDPRIAQYTPSNNSNPSLNALADVGYDASPYNNVPPTALPI